MLTQITKFMVPTWGPPGSCRPQMGSMLAHLTTPPRPQAFSVTYYLDHTHRCLRMQYIMYVSGYLETITSDSGFLLKHIDWTKLTHLVQTQVAGWHFAVQESAIMAVPNWILSKIQSKSFNMELYGHNCVVWWAKIAWYWRTVIWQPFCISFWNNISMTLNTLRPQRNGRYFEDIFKYTLVIEIVLF